MVRDTASCVKFLTSFLKPSGRKLIGISECRLYGNSFHGYHYLAPTQVFIDSQKVKQCYRIERFSDGTGTVYCYADPLRYDGTTGGEVEPYRGGVVTVSPQSGKLTIVPPPGTSVDEYYLLMGAWLAEERKGESARRPRVGDLGLVKRLACCVGLWLISLAACSVLAPAASLRVFGYGLSCGLIGVTSAWVAKELA